MSPETAQAHTTGLVLSIPATFVFLLMSSISAELNTAFLLVAGVVFIAALPWSIISVFSFLSVVPMNTGLHSGMDGYYWRVLLAYSAPVITVLGAHFNGFMFGRSRAKSSKQK